MYDGRIKKLAKTTRKILVIFLFEEKVYKDNCVDAVFIGNLSIYRVPEKKRIKVSNRSV